MLCGSKRFPGVTVTRSGERFSARIANYRLNNQERPGNTGANADRQKALRNFEAGFWAPQIVETIPRHFVARPLFVATCHEIPHAGPGGPARICARRLGANVITHVIGVRRRPCHETPRAETDRAAAAIPYLPPYSLVDLVITPVIGPVRRRVTILSQCGP